MMVLSENVDGTPHQVLIDYLSWLIEVDL